MIAEICCLASLPMHPAFVSILHSLGMQAGGRVAGTRAVVRTRAALLAFAARSLPNDLLVFGDTQ